MGRHRHLQKDLLALLPHAYKEAKMDAKDNLQLLHEIADLSNCNNIMYLEARKHQDLYMWLSKSPSGPSVKCLVENSILDLSCAMKQVTDRRS